MEKRIVEENMGIDWLSDSLKFFDLKLEQVVQALIQSGQKEDLIKDASEIYFNTYKESYELRLFLTKSRLELDKSKSSSLANVYNHQGFKWQKNDNGWVYLKQIINVD